MLAFAPLAKEFAAMPLIRLSSVARAVLAARDLCVISVAWIEWQLVGGQEATKIIDRLKVNFFFLGPKMSEPVRRDTQCVSRRPGLDIHRQTGPEKKNYFPLVNYFFVASCPPTRPFDPCNTNDTQITSNTDNTAYTLQVIFRQKSSVFAI